MTYNITNSLNGYFASLSDEDGSVTAITNAETGEAVSPSDYFGDNENQDLINEIYSIQNDVPFVDNVTLTDLNLSTDEETGEFVSNNSQSNANTETDNNANGNDSPDTGNLPVSQTSADAGDFNEATEDRDFGALVYPIDAQYSLGQDNLYIE